MRKISREELNRILEEEKMGIQADLSYVDLSYFDLSNIDLRYANLRYANLEGANLRGANLKYTDLEHVNLSNADLASANLENADLSNASLRRSDLKHADLQHANLRNADLKHADLRHANLRYANLRYADLEHVNLRHTNISNARLKDANLQDIKIDIHTTGYGLACPEKGSFIGYKKAGECIIELLILEDAKRCSATSAKCRCSKARVLDIEDIRTGEKVKEIRSNYDNDFVYKTGEVVYVNNFDNDRWNECSTGIHFFLNKENAIKY